MDKIVLNEIFSIQIDKDSKEYVNIYEYDKILEQFSLNKRIYTFFKTLQHYTASDEYIVDEINKVKLYGKEIHIKDDIYLQLVNNENGLLIEFYTKDQNNREILYFAKTDYMTQKLFYLMLMPKELKPSLINPQDYKEIIDILSVIKI